MNGTFVLTPYDVIAKSFRDFFRPFGGERAIGRVVASPSDVRDQAFAETASDGLTFVRVLVHVLVGTLLFVVMLLPVIAISILNARIQVNDLLKTALHGAQYALLISAVFLYIVTLVKSTATALRSF